MRRLLSNPVRRLLSRLSAALFPLDALQFAPVEDPPDPERLYSWNLNLPRYVKRGYFRVREIDRGGVSPRASELELTLRHEPSEAFAEWPAETARYLELKQWNKP